MPVEFRKQSYAKIKKDCLSKGTLFEDPEFPATSKSLYFSKVVPDVVWVRPGELCKVPRLMGDAIKCDDLVTGEIRNSWFITASTALAHVPSMWNKVIPEVKGQEYDDKNPYAGILRFNFWRFGQSVEVVIDDRLPTLDGKLIFMHSKQRNEFWPALLEKAYAKLFGDYESMAAGHPSDALVDFTGGISEKVDITGMGLSDQAGLTSFFNRMENASDNKALINCCIRAGKADMGADGPHGLVIGQGYNVTSVCSIEVKKSFQAAVGAKSLRLVRLYNPWTGREYRGPMSTTSKEWTAVPVHEWNKMGVKFDREGEFWMTFEDWCMYFTDADVCHFVNKSYFTLKKTWTETIAFSAWSTAGRNGGNNWDSLSFLNNPQYMFDIITEEPDPVMVSLEQRDVTEGRIAIGDNKNTIGFYIMKVEKNRHYRVHIKGEQVFKSNFFKSRNVFGHCTLPRARYVLIPCCANSDGTGDFMLRIYTGNKTNGKLLNSDAPKSGCCSGRVKLVTTITVESIDGLALPEGSKGTIDPYVVVKCEGKVVQSDPVYDSRSPKIDLMATFYRMKPAMPILIEVFNKNRVFDDYLSETKVDWPGENKFLVQPKGAGDAKKTLEQKDSKKQVAAKKESQKKIGGGEKSINTNGSEKGDKKVYNLYGRGKEADVMKPGNVTVYIRSSDDPQML